MTTVDNEALDRFVAKLTEHTKDVHQEFGQGVMFSSPDMREHMGTMLATPIATIRDANTLNRSNWRVIRADLLERYPDSIEDHRFGHWAVGWLERLYVSASDRDAIGAVRHWVEALENYPVASDSDLSELETDEILWSLEDWLPGRIDPTGNPALADHWDDLHHGQRTDILRHLIYASRSYGGDRVVDLWPEHSGVDVLWDYERLDAAVTDWLRWMFDQAPAPSQEAMRGEFGGW